MYIPLVPAGATVTETAPLYFSKRGEYKNKTFWFSTRFPFGFTYRRAHVRLEEQVLVYPSIDPQPGFEFLLAGIAGDLQTHQRGRGHDFYRIRPYVADESSRHVDWRATAHTRRASGPRVCSRSGPGGHDISRSRHELTRMVRARCRLLRRFLFGGWRSAAYAIRFMTQRWAPEDASVYDILKYLAVVEPHRGLKPSIPHEHTLQIALSTRPNELAEAGWMRARMVTPADLGANGDSEPDRSRWSR